MYGNLLRQPLSVVLVIAAACIGAAPATTTTTRPIGRRGAFDVSFQQQSPLSPIEKQNGRWHIRVAPDQRYTLASERFEVVAPETDSGGGGGGGAKPWGLLVWINAGKRGDPPRQWLPVLEPRHLIWIGADNSGNDRAIGIRFGLALDAVFNMKQRYPIDEKRIYVAGVSGGAKAASMIAVLYPDVFTGAVPIAGAAYFRNIPVPNDPGKVWPAAYQAPGSLLLDRAKHSSRFALLTGSEDFNREPVHQIYTTGFQKDHFDHVEYIEVPGQGHGVPETKWLEQAMESLDASATPHHE
jgi:predicted esterase